MTDEVRIDIGGAVPAPVADILAVDLRSRARVYSKDAVDAMVPGKPGLSPEIALEIINASTGQRVAAIMAWGEVVAPGRPMMSGTHGVVRVDINGGVIDGVGQDGSLDIGPLNVKAVIDAIYKTVRVNSAGGVLDGERHDKSVDFGCLNMRPTLAMSGLVAESGAALALRDRFGVDIEAAEYDAWINSGQVHLYALGKVFQLTDDSANDYIKAKIRGGQFSIVRDDNLRITTPLAGQYPTVAAVVVVVYSDVYGQSLGGGFAAAVITDKPFHDRFWMFGAGQRAYGNLLGHGQERNNYLLPAYDAIHDVVLGHESSVPGVGETSNSGFAAAVLADSTFGATRALMTTCSAVGSANQEMLWREATENTDDADLNTIGAPWANLESKFIRAALFFRLQGKRFIAGPLRHNQGEGNINRDKANHLAGLVKFRDDWQALAERWNALPISGDGGFVGKAPLIVTQTCSGQIYSYPRSEVPWAQLQINVDDPTTALCIGPVYDQTYAGDGVHLDALGQEMQGARQALAYIEWLKGNNWYPLAVRKDGAYAPSRSGATVTLRLYNHFDADLVFDTTTITGLGADQGFRWHDNGDGNTVTVTNAVISNKTTITLTLSDTPTGTGGAIDIAMTGANGANSGPTSGNRATLRTDGVGVTTRSGRDVEFYICIDRVTL